MIIFVPQDFITWTNALMQFPWPIQVDDFVPYAERLGWTPTPRSTWFSVCADDDVGNVIVSENESGNIYRLRVSMVRNMAEDDEGAAELNDHFVSCVAAGKKAWVEPFLLEAGDGPSVTWRLPGDMFAQVARGRRTVMFRFFTPQGQWYFL